MHYNRQNDLDRVELLEAALLEFVGMYGLTEMARRALTIPKAAPKKSSFSRLLAAIAFFR